MSTYAVIKRPTPVLSVLPQSCNRLYDVLATGADSKGRCKLSLRELGEIARLGRQTVYLAMKRLIAVHLIDRNKCGKGRWPRLLIIRAFITGRKSGRKRTRRWRFFSFQQADAHPRHYKETQKKQKEKASKDVPRIRSPGHAMLLLQNVVNNNDVLTDTEREAITSAMGKALFKRGYFDRLQQQPEAFVDILTLLAAPRPPGKPPPKAAVRSVYAWMFGLITSMVVKHEVGIGALIRRLKTHVTPASVHSDKPQRRLGYRRVHRASYSERGKVPSWAS